MSPWDITNIINEKKPHDRAEVLAEYTAWMTNKILANSMDTLILVEEMNKFYHLDKDIQFDFYYYGVPKGKRFSKWYKNEVSSDNDLINIVCRTFNVNERIAKQYLAFLSDQEKQEIITMEGGDNGR